MTTPTETAPEWFEPVEGPDISHIEIEDGEPVDNIYSEKQQRLLTETLYSSWKPVTEAGEPRVFIATANVGLFASPHESPLVPDVLLSLDVKVHPDMAHEKRHQTYFIWEFGKTPEVVVEVVSNRKGGELGKRKQGYEKMRVPYFIVWDPERLLGERELMAYTLSSDRYIPVTIAEMPSIGLALRPWEGAFEGYPARWLRWFEGDTPIATGSEHAEVERARAEAERARADAERVRAEAERQRAEAERQRADATTVENERLMALLAAHGIKAE